MPALGSLRQPCCCALGRLSVSDGLRALMSVAEAKGEALSFAITILAGQWIVGGRVAPSVSWHERLSAELDTAKKEVEEKYLRQLPRKQREGAVIPSIPEFETLRQELGAAMAAETAASDEVTLVDVSAFPAVEHGGQAGGLSVTVVRIPLASINLWWTSESKTIPGRPGFSGGMIFEF